MHLRSPSIRNGEIPDKFRYDEGENPESPSGRNINPAFEFIDVPSEAESLALVMKDIDRPDGDLIHWIVWNIDPKLEKIEEDVDLKDVVVGQNSFRVNEYQGPNPAQGQNRINIELLALDKTLDLPNGSDYTAFKRYIEGSVIDTAEMEAFCSRTGKFALE